MFLICLLLLSMIFIVLRSVEDQDIPFYIDARFFESIPSPKVSPYPVCGESVQGETNFYAKRVLEVI